MSNELNELLKAAANRKITPEEDFEQRVSWMYGMQKLSKAGYTKDEIRDQLRKYYAAQGLAPSAGRGE